MLTKEDTLKDYENNLTQLNSKLEKTIKNIRYCRREFRDTSLILGEINGAIKEYDSK